MEELKIVNRHRGYVKEFGENFIVVGAVHDQDMEWRIPRTYLKMGPGIIWGPGCVVTPGWHGTVLEFDDETHGFMPDYGGPV